MAQSEVVVCSSVEETPPSFTLLLDSRPGQEQRLLEQKEVMLCDNVQEWLQPANEQHRGLLVRRPLGWPGIQEHVDALAKSGIFGSDDSMMYEVLNEEGGGNLQKELAASARDLSGRLMEVGLPQSVGQQIVDDVENVGLAMAALLPDATKFQVKLELMGENCCTRWHKDRYVARSIVTYNGWGTDMAEEANVNLWELENCGNNDHIITDKDRIFFAQAGDIALMKGSTYPRGVGGLVHKSPEKRYHSKGLVMHRLCLKIDVPSTSACPCGNC